MLLPAATFHAVGGMDERFFLHVEDLDLCLRLHRARIPVYFVPHVKVIHQAGTSEASPVRIEWNKTRGFLRYFLIHYRGPFGLLLMGPLGAGVMARFGVRVMRLLLQSLPNRRTNRGMDERSCGPPG